VCVIGATPEEDKGRGGGVVVQRKKGHGRKDLITVRGEQLETEQVSSTLRKKGRSEPTGRKERVAKLLDGKMSRKKKNERTTKKEKG